MKTYIVTFSLALDDLGEVDQPARSPIEAVQAVNRGYWRVALCDDSGCSCSSLTMLGMSRRHTGSILYSVNIDGTNVTYRASGLAVTAR